MDLFATGPLDLAPLFHNRPSVFHNATFDFKQLKVHHNVATPDLHCTCIMARMVFHAIFPEDKKADLGSVIKAFFGEEINKKAGVTDWSIPDLTFEQIKYAAMDVIVLMELYKKLSDYIDKLKLRKVYDLYRKAQLVISEMELNGITVDEKQHRINVIRWREELKDAADEVLNLTGLKQITDAKVAKWLEDSLPHETLSIWPCTESGERLSTSADTFSDFDYLEIVKPFSRYKKLQKLTTSFGMNLLSKVNPATGKIHCSYRVAGARTGRLSCSEPNLTQMPRSKEIRSIFVPSPGYVMVVADYSAVEIRYIAELSQDERMLRAFEQGLDIYKYTVANILHKSIEQVTKEERQIGKSLALGLSYGLSYKKFSKHAKKGYGVEVTEEESKDLISGYRNLYSGLRRWQLEQIETCPLRRYTAYSPMGKSRKLTEETYFGAALNMPVQAGCAEAMLLALLKTKQTLQDTSARMLLSVHDEIVVEAKGPDVEEVTKRITKAMTEAYTELVPHARTLNKLVEPSNGASWADAKN
jgi:DNA polymerase I-like protein with 3'-5' exonuclease and polymerase domains